MSLGQVIDVPSLVEFGRGTITPVKETVVSLGQAVGALDTRLSAIEENGGGSAVKLPDVSGFAVTTNKNTAVIKWTDPSDVVIEDIVFAEWAGTKIVRKEGSAPESKTDGVVVCDSTTRNQYSSSGFSDTGLSYGTTYYYRAFPYADGGAHTAGSSVSVTPARTVISTVPSQSGVLTYGGSAKEPAWSNYDSTKLTIGGDVSGTSAGSYTATFTPKEDYCWSDGSRDAVGVAWTIGKRTFAVPVQSGEIVYDGDLKTASFTGYDPAYMSVSGNTGTAPKTYTARFALKDTANNKWATTDNAYVDVSWVIRDAVVDIPSVTNKSLTYNGSEQGPTIGTYDASIVEISGAKATNAGSYTLTMHLLNSNYYWSDGSKGDQTVSWSIERATATITVSKTSVSLDATKLYDDVTITKTGDGALSVVSSDESVSTVALQSGSVYRITAEKSGSATITVSVPQTTNYKAASKTISVSVSLIDTSLDSYTWAQISDISAAGNASSVFNIGATKEITLNGTVGTLSLSNTKARVFIIGFDHNSAKEGSGISFQGFKSTDGKDICLVDGSYGSNSSDGSKKFNLNHWGGDSSPYNTNYGGWKGCDARYDILGSTEKQPSGYGSIPTTSRVGYDATSAAKTSPVANTLMAALPSDLRAVMKAIIKYTDNVGNSSNTADHVTASTDYLPLLSEFEVHGSRSSANTYEKNSQLQYDYYKNGNSKVKYRHNSTGSAARWWCRSANYIGANTFCSVGADGNASSGGSRHSRGLAPAFLV